VAHRFLENVRIPNTKGVSGVIMNCALFVYRYYSGMQQITVNSSDDFKLQTDNKNDFIGIILSFLEAFAKIAKSGY
jgi:hypothetical protein